MARVFAGVCGALISAMSTVAFAADDISNQEFEERFLAAVSEPNAKIAIGYSHFDFNDILIAPGVPTAFNADQDGFFVEGSFSLPVGEQFGVQIDGLYHNLDNSVDLSVTGIGAHVFWRNPEQALLGGYAEYKEYGDLIETYMLAAEAEFYNGDFSVEAYAGLENLETPFGDSDFFAGEALLAFYPTENARIAAGVRRRFETTSVVLGAEFMADTGGTSPSIFVDAAFGSDDTTTISGGVRLYFGSGSKSLIRRHREDDPVNRLKQGTDAAGTCVNNADSSTVMGPPPAMNSNAIIMPASLYTFEDCTLIPTMPMYGSVPTMTPSPTARIEE